MNIYKFIIYIGTGLLVFGCQSTNKNDNIDCWQPWTTPIKNADDLAIALEKRWTIPKIREYCRLNKPMKGIQNLVTMHEVWEGVLFGDNKSEFSRFYWYADTINGKIINYSVNAVKGTKFWIVDVGDEESLRRPPKLLNYFTIVERAAKEAQRPSWHIQNRGVPAWR